MKLIELLRKESTVSLLKLILVAVLAGLTQAVVLGVINSAAHAATVGRENFNLLLMFIGALVGHIWSQKYILQTSAVLVEGVLSNIRLRIADKIRDSELQYFEKIGRSRIYSNVTKETVTISQAAPTIVIAGQSGIMVVFALLYLAWLSLAALLVTVILIIIGGSVHLSRLRERRAEMQRALTRENQLFDLLTHLLDGFKEVKMNEARSDDLGDHLREVSALLRELKIKTEKQFAVNFIFSETAFYVLIATIAFVLPQLAGTSSEIIVKSTATILFIIGPLTTFIASIPAFSSANLAAENIYELEEELDKGHEFSPRPSISRWSSILPTQDIEFEDVRFDYLDRDGSSSFSVGPVNLTLHEGETVFIVGGNGSGKSTFLKLLTGLYFPMSGKIKANGVDLRELDHARYRDAFSVIFSDYHLFDRLYGVRNVDSQRVQELLEVMGLHGKTEWENDHFTNLDLSTGQRKRLALLMSFIEDKQIYVFDEWAADQDQNFRKYFYQVLLKDLKKKGKTIIAVTHDEQYFDVADRVLKMEYGQFVTTKKGNK